MSALDIARDGWGEDMPDWIRALATEVEATSQNRTAKRIGYSAATVSTLLRRRYGADTTMVEERVRGELMRETILCPARGEITKSVCQDWRKKARNFSGHNRDRVLMFRACTGCPLHQKEKADE